MPLKPIAKPSAAPRTHAVEATAPGSKSRKQDAVSRRSSADGPSRAQKKRMNNTTGKPHTLEGMAERFMGVPVPSGMTAQQVRQAFAKGQNVDDTRNALGLAPLPRKKELTPLKEHASLEDFQEHLSFSPTFRSLTKKAPNLPVVEGNMPTHWDGTTIHLRKGEAPQERMESLVMETGNAVRNGDLQKIRTNVFEYPTRKAYADALEHVEYENWKNVERTMKELGRPPSETYRDFEHYNTVQSGRSHNEPYLQEWDLAKSFKDRMDGVTKAVGAEPKDITFPRTEEAQIVMDYGDKKVDIVRYAEGFTPMTKYRLHDGTGAREYATLEALGTAFGG